VTDEEKLERIARELCSAAGQDPDARVRLGPPLAFAAGECTIVKPLIVPAWKAYCREARRLSMSDAEHAEGGTEPRKLRRRRRVARLRASPRLLRIVLRRRLRRVQLIARLSALHLAARQGISAWPRRSRMAITEFVAQRRHINALSASLPYTERKRRLFAHRAAYRSATRGRWARRV
jgi:hypothetical protein